MNKSFFYRIEQIRVPLNYSNNLLVKKAGRACRIPAKHILSHNIIRRSIDARKEPNFVLTLEIELPFSLKKTPRVALIEKSLPLNKPKYIGKQKIRPIVVGAGPAGLWAAWQLAKAGLQPLLIERGEKALVRAKKVNRFWKDGVLDNDSNVLYGEGGAGLFSDGKLTARSKERGKVSEFLKLLVRHGASKDILIDTQPHIGSDKLLKIIPSIGDEIIELGGEIKFSTKLTDLSIKDSKLISIKANEDVLPCERLILAVGHSAREIYKLLDKKGITLKPKPFAIGVRVELSQEDINRSQYRCYTKELGSASFRLTKKANKTNRTCYSFCMCPGGEVISCASETGYLTTNGMSLHKRNKPFGNAAFLIPVTPEDLIEKYGASPFAGVKFQKNLEKNAFIAGGSDYSIPASTLTDFINNNPSPKDIINFSATKIKSTNINNILPKFIKQNLHNSIPKMLKQLNSPNPNSITIYATETRSSSPIQISRTELGETVGITGIYPAGEGAGYAGGIVSSGVDGLKIAESIIHSY